VFKWSSVCASRPAVMGVVNVTPDSFSDGGAYFDSDAAIAHGLDLAADGADLLDVGGESTRPGAAPVDQREERARVVPVIAALARDAGVPVSVDTSKAAVASAAIEAGAVVVNDVTAGRADADMLRLVADAGAGFVAMHMRGEPRTMQHDPRYADVVGEVAAFLRARVEAACDAGVDADALCVDPGIGFGKTGAHNLMLLARLAALVAATDAPVMIGASRKSFIGSVLGGLPVAERDDGTLATTMWAIDHGASVVRVHAVRPAVDATRLWHELQVARAAA
jgi:dihydropteroate synthase